LEEVGVVAVLPDGAVAAGEEPADSATAVIEAATAQAHRKEFERSRLEMMRGYAEGRDCRRRYLLTYFGEDFGQLCGHCDNCEAGRAAETTGDEPFPANSRVRHRAWGGGLVLRYEGDKVVVLFDEVGYKTLATTLALDEGLLVPAAD
jgi:ATP-dependent DNA helicase RecQ